MTSNHILNSISNICLTEQLRRWHLHLATRYAEMLGKTDEEPGLPSNHDPPP